MIAIITGIGIPHFSVDLWAASYQSGYSLKIAQILLIRLGLVGVVHPQKDSVAKKLAASMTKFRADMEMGKPRLAGVLFMIPIPFSSLVEEVLGFLS